MIIKCPTCSTKFRLPSPRMKTTGIRVRCSHCDFVFRAGPPGPGDKYAKVLARVQKADARPKTTPPPLPKHSNPVPPRPSHLDVPEGPTQIMPADLFLRPTSNTKDALVPGKWDAVLEPAELPSIESVSPVSASAASPEQAPEQDGSALDGDLFEDLPSPPALKNRGGTGIDHSDKNGIEPDARAISIPDAPGQEISISASLDFNDLFEAESSASAAVASPPEMSPELEHVFETVPNSAVRRIAEEFVAESDRPPSTEALGKIQLNQARPRRDGSMETVRRNSSFRHRSSSLIIENVVAPGHWLRAMAVLVLVTAGVLGILLYRFPPKLDATKSINAAMLKPTMKRFLGQLSSATAGVYKSGSSPFQVLELTAVPFRLGQTEHDVLLIRGRALNTSAMAFEDVSVTAEIVYAGESIRRTMTTLGLRLSDRRLAQVRNKKDLAQVWIAARSTAHENGRQIAPSRETRDFTFILWDVPAQIVDSAIYVAFRTQRARLSP
jgi:predicted Zn finger-like uncharacterized protein